jgi:hypothetical protein
MIIEWDEQKRLTNLKKHGLDFSAVEICFESPIFEWKDTSFDYGETRFIAYASFFGRVVNLVYTKDSSTDTYRIISFRKANERETKN